MMTLKEKIKNEGLKIGFIEAKANIPKSALYQYLDGNKGLTKVNFLNLKKVLKKYKINLDV